MKKLIIISLAVAIIFVGSARLSSAAMSDSVLLGALFDMVQDLVTSINAMIERQLFSTPTNTGIVPSTTINTGVVPSTTTVPPKPTPGVISFNVTSPNSQGEKWTSGKTYQIKWEVQASALGAAAEPNFVSLYLISARDTAVRPTVLWTVASFTRNTGSYEWTISKNLYPGDYKVAIEAYANSGTRTYGNTFTIYSDAVISTGSGTGTGTGTGTGSVTGTGSSVGTAGTTVGFNINITNPSVAIDGVWAKGVMQTIRWESTNQTASPLKETDYVSIYVVPTKNVNTRVLTISNKAYNDGDFRWVVNKTLAQGLYRIVIQSVSNPSMKAVSSEFFLADMTSRTMQLGDTFINASGVKSTIQQQQSDEQKRGVWCCNNCYTLSGTSCGGCFRHCGAMD